MVYFNASNPSAPGTEYHNIIIRNEPLLTQCGFTKFSLPLNGGTKMILYNHKFKSMITYFDFDEYNSIEKTVKLVRDKPIEEQKVDVKVVEILCTYLRNACVSLEEDPDSEFFKNGNRNGNGKPKSTNNNESKSKSKGGTTKEKQQKQEQEEEERPPDLILSFPLNNGRPN